MSIAWQAGAHILQYISGSTSAGFRAALDALLVLAGWGNRVIIGGGFIYSVMSPQGLFMKVKIWDHGAHAGLYPAVSFQLMSEDGVTAIGCEHMIEIGASPADTYTVLVNQCQLWISIPAAAEGFLPGGTSTSYSFACGIPHTPSDVLTDCTVEGGAAAIDMLWWSCGSGANAFGPSMNFRNSLVCGPAATPAGDFPRTWCACRNGVVTFSDSVNRDFVDAASLRLTYLSETGGDFLHPAAPVLYKIRKPLDIDPGIEWLRQIQGQLYNAFIRTNPEGRDTFILTPEGTDPATGLTIYVPWTSWADQFDGTLFLQTGPPQFTESADNYAY